MSKRNLFVLFAVAALALAVGCGKTEETAPVTTAPAAASATTIDPATAGSITGKVSFEGEKPKAKPIRMDQDAFCSKAHATPIFFEDVVVNDNGTLRNVLVYVKGGLEGRTFTAPAEAAKLDQTGCQYVPHVVSLMKDQKLDVVNSDSTNHNVNVLAEQNRPWNKSQAPNKSDVESFPREEIVIPVKCNIHPWMKTYIGVFSHPFHAVTGADGTFELKGLPPGDYEIEAWHEKYGTKTQKVTVAASESKAADFAFQPAP